MLFPYDNLIIALSYGHAVVGKALAKLTGFTIVVCK